MTYLKEEQGDLVRTLKYYENLKMYFGHTIQTFK